MKLKAQRPIVEIAAEWIAACCLGGAVVFALVMLAPGGPLVAGLAGLTVAVGAITAMGRVDRDTRGAIAAFEPVELCGGERQEAADDVLLLDEPLAVAESRVVRLFTAGPDASDGKDVVPEPGEMLARIEKFLGATRSEGSAVPARPANVASAEASAALHAALADIRRSLRQG